MSLQITTLVECLVTFGAGKWLLYCVDPSMCLQITTWVGWLVTFVAGKWGWLVTFGAGKWLLSQMDPFMLLHMTTLVEWLVPYGAGKWLFSCRSFHVSSNHHSGWMTFYIWSRQMASLQCGSFHVSSNHNSDWMSWHLEQANGLPECMNALSHLGQENGISPVNPSMSLPITTRVGWFVTFGAGKWLLSSVEPFMLLKMTTLVEWLVTFGTGKWLFFVDPLMCL